MPPHQRHFKRVVILSDFHCGHVTGLTPPGYRSGIGEWPATEAEAWDEYLRIIDSLQPIDVLIVNGDLIDGKGRRSDGTELITTNCMIQAEMAKQCIQVTGAKSIIIIRGTPYHVGEGDDYEDLVAKWVNADKIGDHVWVDVNGLVFNCKHKISSSSVPYGKGTAISKEKVQERLWGVRDANQNADIIIRSHVHYYHQVAESDWWGCTTPALQGWTKFGARQCSGTIDWGLLSFDVKRDGTFTPYTHIRRLESQQVEIVRT